MLGQIQPGGRAKTPGQQKEDAPNQFLTRATRNPTCSDALGGSGMKISEQQFLPLSYQLPPRCRPGVAVNSPTLPCMS